jgi:trans-aconitate methyltransferase
MGAEKGASYYDSIYRARARNGVYDACPLQTQFYGELWSVAAKLVPQGKKVIDIGCGPGEFASVFRISRTEEYIGYDFSSAAIEVASARELVSCDFIIGDVRRARETESHGVCYVCLEVLEHIEEDKELLRALSTENPLIISVPTFDSAGHVRWFATCDDVIARYRPIFPNIKHAHTINVKNGHKLFILTANI